MTETKDSIHLKPSERIARLWRSSDLTKIDAVIAYLDEREESVHPIARVVRLVRPEIEIEVEDEEPDPPAVDLPPGLFTALASSDDDPEPAHPAPTSSPSDDMREPHQCMGAAPDGAGFAFCELKAGHAGPHRISVDPSPEPKPSALTELREMQFLSPVGGNPTTLGDVWTGETAPAWPYRNPPCACLACAPQLAFGAKMRVCSLCGNKRCPHTDDHRNVCTSSNVPNQEAVTWRQSLVATRKERDEALTKVRALESESEAIWLDGWAASFKDGVSKMERVGLMSEPVLVLTDILKREQEANNDKILAALSQTSTGEISERLRDALAKLSASEVRIAELEADRETWRHNPDLTPSELADAVKALKSHGGPDGGPAEMFWAELGDVALDCYAAAVSRADHAESRVADVEARCAQLEGKLTGMIEGLPSRDSEMQRKEEEPDSTPDVLASRDLLYRRLGDTRERLSKAIAERNSIAAVVLAARAVLQIPSSAATKPLLEELAKLRAALTEYDDKESCLLAAEQIEEVWRHKLAESEKLVAELQAELAELQNKLDTTAWLLWDVRTKPKSQLEHENWGGRADEWLDFVLPKKPLSALDPPVQQEPASERPIVVGSTWSRKRDSRQVRVTSVGPVEPKRAPSERSLDYEGKDVFGRDLQWRFLQEFTHVSDPPAVSESAPVEKP